MHRRHPRQEAPRHRVCRPHRAPGVLKLWVDVSEQFFKRLCKSVGCPCHSLIKNLKRNTGSISSCICSDDLGYKVCGCGLIEPLNPKP